MAHHQHLVLLVGPVSLVESGGRGKSKALSHEAYAPEAREFLSSRGSCQDVLSNEQAPRKPVRAPPLDSNLHSLSRQLIELRIEHADLDATIDRLAEARRKTSCCCGA
jgi:hypothetical protein